MRRKTYFLRDFLGSFAHAVEDNVRNIMVDIVKLLEEMGQAFFVVVIDHSVDVVNLSDVGVMAFKVFGEAVRVLLLNMVSPAFSVINMALEKNDKNYSFVSRHAAFTFVVLSSFSLIIRSKASRCLKTFLKI